MKKESWEEGEASSVGPRGGSVHMCRRLRILSSPFRPCIALHPRRQLELPTHQQDTSIPAPASKSTTPHTPPPKQTLIPRKTPKLHGTNHPRHQSANPERRARRKLVTGKQKNRGIPGDQAGNRRWGEGGRERGGKGWGADQRGEKRGMMNQLRKRV